MDAVDNLSALADLGGVLGTSTMPSITSGSVPTMEQPSNITSVEHFNDLKAFVLIPVVVYSALCMVVGVTGSALVCFICGFKLRKNVTNTFVLALAAVDLVSCLVCIPLEIMELRIPFMFDYPIFCKLQRTIRSLTTITSGLILVAIAIERYNRICKPLNKHTNIAQAHRTCGALVLIGVTCSWPAVIVFGSKSTELSPSIIGVECSTGDNLSQTFYPFAFYVFLFLVYFATSMCLCVLYTLIATKIWQRRKLLTGLRTKERAPAMTDNYSSDVNSHAKFVENLATNIQNGKMPRPSVAIDACPHTMKRKRLYSRKRTTCIVFFMTLTFIVSCLPYIIVSICRSIFPEMFTDLSDAGEVFFHLALKSFMISSAVNPYIYGFSNGQFKEECYKIFRKIYCGSKDGQSQKYLTGTTPSGKATIRLHTESEA